MGCCLLGFILMAFTGTLVPARAFSMASCSLGTSSSSARPSASSAHLSTLSDGLPSPHPGALLGVLCERLGTICGNTGPAERSMCDQEMSTRMCWASWDDRPERDSISKDFGWNFDRGPMLPEELRQRAEP